MERIFLQPFNLLDNNKQKLFLISFCFVFGIIFLNVFVPFNINLWENDTGFQQFFRLSKLATIAILVLLFSQFILRRIFKVFTFKVIGFIGWLCIEIALIALVLTAVYKTNNEVFLTLFFKSIQHTFLIILIPYFITLLLLYVYQTRTTNKIIPASHKPNGLIGIPDEKGVNKIVIQLSNVLYFESADNYIVIYYLDEEKVKKKLIRNTLKKMESVLDSSIIKR